MASSKQTKACVGCQNGIVTCNGCNERFCLPHFNEHRHEIDKRLDEVVQEHNQLRDSLSPQATPPDLLSRIDQWEQSSIEKIKNTAQQARKELEQCLERTKNQLENTLEKMAGEMKSSQQIGNYSEKDTEGWMKELQRLRLMLERPPIFDIIEDDMAPLAICMLKVIEKGSAETLAVENGMIVPPYFRASSVETSKNSIVDPHCT